MRKDSENMPVCPICEITLRLPVATLPDEEEGCVRGEATEDVPRQPKNQLEGLAAQRIEPSLAYMLAHLDEPLRISQLSRMADISNSHFFALFKQAMGESPIKVFIRARMHRACVLLLETRMSVKEVAASLGYHDEFYFSRVFKSVQGLSPSYYRAQCDMTERKSSTSRA
jgi:AraC-like DNA-binding protein